MRFAYLVLAHRDVAQLRALFARLLRDDPSDLIVLHVDRACDVSDDELRGLKAQFGEALILTPRSPIRWGHSSQSVADLLLMRGLDGLDYDYAHLISGQDWPIRDKAAMVAGLRPDACYVTLEDPPMAHRMNALQLHNRLASPHQKLSAAQHYFKQGLRRTAGWLDRAARATGRTRSCPFGPEWKKGSAWWSLPRAALDYAAERLEATIESGRLRFTICSDEHVVQTILAYSPFADRLTDNRRYYVWRPGNSSPDWLTRADLPALRASSAWFARKLDRERDPFFMEL